MSVRNRQRGMPPIPPEDDRPRMAEPHGRPNRRRFESVFAALLSPTPASGRGPATTGALPAAKPAIDAYTLVALWRHARMAGDVVNERSFMAELERLAERRPPRVEGDRDGIRD
jgi:hypothetical protein